MKKKCYIALLLLAAVTFAGCSSGTNATPAASAPSAESEEQNEMPPDAETEDAQFKIIAGQANPETHPYHLGLAKFGEILEEKTDGAIVLDAFHSAQLGSERDLVEGMQLGTVQGAVITSAPLSSFTDSYLVFDLPFLFENVEEARNVCDSEIGYTMLASLEDKGVMGLSFFENGMRNITNSKNPIELPEDLQGIKIRTMENPIHMNAFIAMGADPTPMAFGELFTALQQKAIDAQENPFVVIEANNFFEVQDYLSITEHLYSPAPLMMASSFFDSLPAELQDIVYEAAQEAKVYQRAVCDEQEAMLLQKLEDVGMIINFPEKAPFIEATQSVYDTYVGEGEGLVSPEIFEAVKEVLGK